jgi:2-C-methyl-D-erythritol 2,4-cyclodiphosphate synthase
MSSNNMPSMRIGEGFDVHALVPGRKLILGGIEIPHDKGLLGHSDADVLLHTITDAVLGAAGLGDIGELFPDSDEKFKGADSALLLAQAMKQVRAAGYDIVNVDCTVIAEKPRLVPYKQAIRENIARVLNVNVSQVNVKAKTTEKLGFTGRGEGMAAKAVVLLSRS